MTSALSHAPTLEAIQALPKLEMHIHLEGTINPEFVATLAAQQNIELPRPLDNLYDLGDIGAFLKTLDWVCSLVKSTDDAKQIAHNFGLYCQRENIHYCELIVNPTHWSNIQYQALLPALCDAFDEIAEQQQIDIRLLPSILRQQSAEAAMEMVEWMGQAKLPRIVGLSIDGNEAAAGRTGPRFAPVYARARELGFGLTAHAGESSGASGVVDALDLLKVDRIDHGVRAIDDPALVDRLVETGTTLNVCITSNCCILYDSIDVHPFAELHKRGVKMTLNTDDPVVVKTLLCDELYWIANHIGLSLGDLVELQHNAIDSAFCNESTRCLLRDRLTQSLNQLH